ncbi:hypothetical protein A1507_11195 [Methylomonas koyamae]|uniref:Uncharacterized protein n=2 Tax=Methylomonas koyamae TaxID=702114 RepID=A0A177NG56_9GAMM|nr:hypothetical protein A1507_11195 [Methylomonas koyamae]
MPSIVPVTLINTGLLYFFSQGVEIDAQAVTFFLTNWKLSGLAAAVSTAAIGALGLVLPRQVKDALVYLRWPYAAPGHRAFSIYAQHDMRVDYDRLKAEIPELQDQWSLTPEIENKVWYRIFKKHEKVPAVSHAHRMWLMFRDLTSLAYLFLGAFIIAGLYFKPDVSWAFYLSIVLTELLVFWSAARNSGGQLICNVLASASVK